MPSPCLVPSRRLATASVRLLHAALACVMLSLPHLSMSAEASDLSEETRACLKCHDKPGLDKKIEDGSRLPLHVSTQGFVASQHGETDCEDCHSAIDADSHGKVRTPIKSRREYQTSMRTSCRDCHKKNFKTYDDGVHAAMIAEGSDKAPFCADCHEPHTLVSVKEAQPVEKTPCATCHKDVFTAYIADVHGVARIAKGRDAPLCADCHKSHDIKAASFGTGIRDACLNCHDKAVGQHAVWLPNTARHFDAISCPACHSPGAERRVNLRMFDAGTGVQLAEKSGVPQFKELASSADADNRGLNERALHSLLENLSSDRGNGKVMLQGRLELRNGVNAHRIAEKTKAIKDCNACHTEGAEPFQSVTVTIAGPDGRPLRHGVQKEVLNSLVSIESVRGFYAIGANRIKLLDWLLLLAVAGSIGGCAAHWGVRRAFRRLRERESMGSRRETGDHAN